MKPEPKCTLKVEILKINSCFKEPDVSWNKCKSFVTHDNIYFKKIHGIFFNCQPSQFFSIENTKSELEIQVFGINELGK